MNSRGLGGLQGSWPGYKFRRFSFTLPVRASNSCVVDAADERGPGHQARPAVTDATAASNLLLSGHGRRNANRRACGWPYFGALLSDGFVPPRSQHWAIPLHAVPNLIWLGLFGLQALLIWKGRAAPHQRLGDWFGAYGAGLTAVLFFAAVSLIMSDLRTDGNIERHAGRVFGTLVIDVGMFAGFLAAGWRWRTRPEAHKRLMLLATLSLVMIGFGRLVGRELLPLVTIWGAYAVLMSPLVTLAVHDWMMLRRVYAVTLVGIALFALRLVKNRPVGLLAADRACVPFGDLLARHIARAA